MATEIPTAAGKGWRADSPSVSLPEVYASIPVPHGAGFWRKMFAFAGPGYLVAVGYMDPGNWATDQACRDSYSWPVTIALWLLCEVAIAACDLAEVIGSAIALNLLFHLPLLWGVCLTALDVLAVLYLQQKGFRSEEAFVIALIGVI